MAEYDFHHLFNTAAEVWDRLDNPGWREGVVHLAAELLLPDMEQEYAIEVLSYAFKGAVS